MDYYDDEFEDDIEGQEGEFDDDGFDQDYENENDDGYGEDIGDGYGEDFGDPYGMEDDEEDFQDDEDDENEEKDDRKELKTPAILRRAKEYAARYGFSTKNTRFVCPKCGLNTLYPDKKSKTFIRGVGASTIGVPSPSSVKRWVCLNPRCSSFWPAKGHTFSLRTDGKVKAHTLGATLFHVPK